MDCYATTPTDHDLEPYPGRWGEYAQTHAQYLVAPPVPISSHAVHRVLSQAHRDDYAKGTHAHAPPFTHRWHYPLLYANALAVPYAAPPHQAANATSPFPTLTSPVDERELVRRQYGDVPEHAAQVWQAQPVDISLDLDQDELIYPDADPDEAVPPTPWYNAPAQAMESVPAAAPCASRGPQCDAGAAAYPSPTTSERVWDQRATAPALSVDTTMAQGYLQSAYPSPLSPGAPQDYDALFDEYTCEYEPQIDTFDGADSLHPLPPPSTSTCYALMGAITPITPPPTAQLPPAPTAPLPPPPAPTQTPRAAPKEKRAGPFLRPLTPPPGVLHCPLGTPPDPAPPQPPSSTSATTKETSPAPRPRGRPRKHPLPPPPPPPPQPPAPVPYTYPKLGPLPGESTFHVSSPTATPEDSKAGVKTDAEPPKEKKKPAMACLFCRERKIACAPLGDAPEGGCNQCAKRRLTCVYPTESRRGQHRRKPAAEREPPKHAARTAKIASAHAQAQGEAWNARIVAARRAAHREQRKERVRAAGLELVRVRGGSAEVKVEL